MITQSTSAFPPHPARPYPVAEDRGEDILLDPSFPYREDLLQFIWEQGLYRKEGLRTEDGAVVEVLHAGVRQFNSGPDLVDAVLRIDGQVWAGTVEVHVRASEWFAHGHHTDPAYDNVVLHAVWVHDMDVRTLGGGRPRAVVLRDRVEPERLGVFEHLMKRKDEIPCAELIHDVGGALLDHWCDQVLEQRLERKAREVDALFTALGRDALGTVHHLLLRALGGKVNAEPFGMLAHALPLRTLLKVRDDAMRTEALLFGQAGLLRTDFVDEHPRLLQREHVLLARLHGLSPAPTAAWKFGRLRPSAFPSVRIAQYARFVMRHGDSLMRLLEVDDLLELRALLEMEAGPYWTTHHRFDHTSPASVKRLGTEAIDHVVINAVVPLRLALGRSLGRRSMEQGARELLRQLPPERNVIIRGWERIGVRVPDAARSQALLELKSRSCAHHRCLTCGIGHELLKRPTS